MKKIYIADDKNTNFKSLKLALEELIPKCQVAHAENGLQIVEMVNREKPDLVLMDVVMPLMDGVEATIEIRKKYSKKELPIIAMTAQDMTTARPRVLDAGCDEYFSKPYSLVELMEKVNFYLGLVEKKPVF